MAKRDMTKNVATCGVLMLVSLGICMLFLSLFPVAVAAAPYPIKKVKVERLPDLNTPREGHAVFFAGGELVVAGGHTNGFVLTATAEYLNDGKWHQLPMTYPHDHGTALILNSGKVLLAGGSKEGMGVGQSYGVELYDPSSRSFTGIGCLNKERTLASALELDSGRVIITGNWYADDGIEMFDGQKLFSFVKPVATGRVVPYLFRTTKGDVLIVGDRDPYDHLADTIVVDRLYGEPFVVPLLRQWRPLTYNAPTTAAAGFIGAVANGRCAYLMAVRNYERTLDKPELKGKPAGQLAVVLVEDTVFTLLPTVNPIPMMSPLGTGPIFYDRGYIVADRQAQCAYLCGIDKDKRLYVVSINYVQRPSPLTLYYTDPLPDCGFYVPVLTPQGNLAIIGGSSETNFDSDNFTPTASAWLVLLGLHEDATIASSRWPAGWLWWLMGALVVLSGIALLFVRRRKPNALQPVRQTESDESRKELSETEDFSNSKAEELMSRIDLLMEDEQLYLRRDLRLQDVAVLLHVNSSYVSECINSMRGQSFSQFVNACRIRHAQEKLLKHETKVTTIAAESGFSTESSFFRNFKAVTGMTPREWIDTQQTRDSQTSET